MTEGTHSDKWTAWGERLATGLDELHATVVAAHDPEAAALVALAVARIQGAKRRVAVADLVGEVPVIQELVDSDDPHGISDSFLYGVSLNKIARPVDSGSSVFIMPSGTESVANEDVYSNERWRRLAAGFHQVGALLLVVANPETPGFTDLCGYVGSLLPVGEYRGPLPHGIPLAAPLSPRSARVSPASGAEATAAKEGGSGTRERKAREAAAQDGDTRSRNLIVLVLVLFALALAVGAMWPRIREMLPSPIASLVGATESDAGAEPLVSVPATVDSTALTGGAGTDVPAAGVAAPITSEPGSIPVVTNPDDSTRDSRYAIYFTSANTREAAMPDERVRSLPSVAMTPVDDGTEVWYRLTVGAYSDKTEAEAMLKRLRDEKLIGSGSIVRVPYALMLESEVGTDAAAARTASFARRGIIAYALRQQDGSANIYTGAFETPRQAVRLADSLRTAGINPVLVHRTGRAL